MLDSVVDEEVLDSVDDTLDDVTELADEDGVSKVIVVVYVVTSVEDTLELVGAGVSVLEDSVLLDEDELMDEDSEVEELDEMLDDELDEESVDEELSVDAVEEALDELEEEVVLDVAYP